MLHLNFKSALSRDWIWCESPLRSMRYNTILQYQRILDVLHHTLLNRYGRNMYTWTIIPCICCVMDFTWGFQLKNIRLACLERISNWAPHTKQSINTPTPFMFSVVAEKWCTWFALVSWCGITHTSCYRKPRGSLCSFFIRISTCGRSSRD